jgi:hypothetical protein
VRRERATKVRALALLPLVSALVCPVASAVAASPTEGVAGASGTWFSLAALTGTTQPDPTFADYQWDIRPRIAWGAEALAGRGPFSAGVRWWRSQTTQVIDPSGAQGTTNVHTTSFDLVGEGRFARLLGVEVLGAVHVGRLFLGYDPDQVTVNPGAIVVDLEPVQEWAAGGGLTLRRALRQHWNAGLEVDHRLFRMDTAHRNGSQIEVGRETFGDWSARLGLAWVVGRR